MPQYADARQEKHAASHTRWQAAAAKHRKAESAARAAGKAARTELARKAAEKAEKHAKTHAREAEKLTVPAARATGARRQMANAAADRILAEAVHEAATPEVVEVVLSPKEERRLAKESEKRERAEHEAQVAAALARRRAGIDHHPDTAAAQREVVVTGAPGAPKVARYAEYGALIRNVNERTVDRIRAMEAFDTLCHRAFAGLFPEPRFERGVDTTKSLPGVPDDRADGLRSMQNLTARIGVEAQALMFHRVYERRQFTWMAAQGMGDERDLAVLFLCAVDATARCFGLGRPSKAVEVMEARLDLVAAS